MLKYIFVHGLSGWGSYDKQYERMPYWGMRNGDLMAFIKENGYDCYAASVAPVGSAWDRACELYAQLTGSKVDYGAVHSEKNQHERYGRDFSDCPLITDWDNTKMVLIGHSFGGATIRMFADLMINGDEEERQTQDASPLFQGGMADKIHALITLASPLNGTSAYDLTEDPTFDPNSVKAPFWSNWTAKLMNRTKVVPDRDPRDYAAWDMHIDVAAKWNEKWKIHPDIYYFSVPCSITKAGKDGYHRPDLKRTEPLYVRHSYRMGVWTGTTKGGIKIDENWWENDGLVNTISSRAPLQDPRKELDPNDIRPGIWNIFKTFEGDHMSIQGGLLKKKDVFYYYLYLLSIIPK